MKINRCLCRLSCLSRLQVSLNPGRNVPKFFYETKMFLTTTNCLICHDYLTLAESIVDFEKLSHSFDVFCKFLNVQLVETNTWDFSKENCPLCPNCLTFVDDVSFNFDILETARVKIQAVTRKVTDIVKEVNQQETTNINYCNDDRVKGFREQVIKGIDDDKCEPHKIIKRTLPSTRCEYIELDEDEEEEEDIGDNFFDSFVNRNIAQLQFEESLELQHVDTGNDDEISEYEGSDGNQMDSGNEGLTDDEDERPSRPGPKCSKFNDKKESTRSRIHLTEVSAGQYSYAGIEISKSGHIVRCSKCPQKEFKFISEVVGHIEHDHLGNKMKRNVYPCQICGQMLARKKLKFHNESHQQRRHKTRHKCKICSTILTNVDDLRQHQAQNHSDVHEEALRDPPPLPPRVIPSKTLDGHLNYLGVDIIIDNDKSYRCSLCPEKAPCTTRKMILNHIREKHINPPEEGQQLFCGIPITVQNGCFSCDLCPDRAPYRLKRSLISHIKDKHLERDKPWLKCEVCSKEYRTLTMLNIHRKSHQNSSYHWFCDSCGKFFNSEVILKHHKKQVHERIIPEKKFACSYAGCDKRYVTQKLLEIHFRLHTGELPFKCEYCDKRFRQEKLKMVHYRRKHAEETPFKCNFCSEAFHDSTFVQSHLKSKHPEVTDRRKGLAYQVIYNIRPII